MAYHVLTRGQVEPLRQVEGGMAYRPQVVLNFVRDPVDPLPVQGHYIRVPLDRISTRVQTCSVKIQRLSFEVGCFEYFSET